MSNKEEKDLLPGVPKTSTPAVFTAEQLAEMLIATQKQLADALQKQSEAILESRKPYVDPKVLEARRLALEERQRSIAMDQAERAARKKVCPHTRENGTPNIKWHEFSNSIVLGVCGTCFSQFDARNLEDLKLLRADLKSQKNMGRAGAHARRGVVFAV